MIRKVLLADDEERVLAFVSAALENDGTVEIRTVTKGEEALEVARQWGPDLILLDVILPGMNGFEVCHALKSDPATANIKIVLLTGVSPDPDGYKVFGEAEADDYITKPFSAVELFQKFQRMQGQLMADE